MKARTAQWGALAAAAALAVGLLGCAPKYAPRISVKTAPAHAGRIVRTVEFSGVLVPNHTVNIFAKLAGHCHDGHRGRRRPGDRPGSSWSRSTPRS